MNIYVGNLSYEVVDGDLEKAFSAFGTVVSAKVISDKYTGKSRGFGFVEMGSGPEGEEAIERLNGSELKGRAIVVNEARPKSESGGGERRGGGGNRGGGGRGRGGRDSRDSGRRDNW
ncbi:MAG: RNA-binding protein [Deltaproteobacteria bacterium]|nr:RNA-binding protein [Deltaproteobacteria bacterium]